MKKYNLVVGREGKDGKTFWDKVGVMFKRDKGGYSLSLSMFPNLRIMAFEEEEREYQREQPRKQRTAPEPDVDMDDEESIPF